MTGISLPELEAAVAEAERKIEKATAQREAAVKSASADGYIRASTALQRAEAEAEFARRVLSDAIASNAQADRERKLEQLRAMHARITGHAPVTRLAPLAAAVAAAFQHALDALGAFATELEKICSEHRAAFNLAWELDVAADFNEFVHRTSPDHSDRYQRRARGLLWCTLLRDCSAPASKHVDDVTTWLRLVDASSAFGMFGLEHTRKFPTLRDELNAAIDGSWQSERMRLEAEHGEAQAAAELAREQAEAKADDDLDGLSDVADDSAVASAP